MRIGVLALQGAFIEHIHKLRELGIPAVEVRLPQDMPGLDGLIIPAQVPQTAFWPAKLRMGSTRS